jgi:hypothetical protein
MEIQTLVRASLALSMIAGGALYARERDEKQTAEHSLAASAASLPKIGLSREDVSRIDRIELTEPDDESSTPRISLEKHGEDWRLSEPISTSASAAKVSELLENLKQLTIAEAIDAGTGYYQRYDLTAARAFHVVAWSGQHKMSDLYFGKSSARGQLVRVAGIPGVFDIDPTAVGSYSGFLYTRPLRSWREPSMLHFDVDDVLAVDVNNAHGAFSFSKVGGVWAGSFRVRCSTGTLSAPHRGWPKFDPSTVRELLQAFHSLSADEFGQESDRAQAGLEQAEQTGGVIRLRLKTGQELAVRVGRLAKGPSSWSIQDSRWAIKDGGDGTLYALALWTTDWVTSDQARFENPNAR